VTERKIRDVALSGQHHPLAYLVQRMFIVVRQPPLYLLRIKPWAR
jgi:hypothetical protein